MIVPKMIAERMIDLAHPLHWSKAPGAFFRETVPVESDGTRLDDVNNKMAAERAWQRTAEQQAFIFEDVVFPINEDISAEIQNILAVSGFRASKDEKRLALRYDYALRRCVRSNFGIVWERSGLDIDGGTYDALAIPIAHLSSDCVTLADKAEQGKIPLGTDDAQPRNITELRSGPWASPEDVKATTKLDPYSRTRVDSVEEPLAAIRRVARQLETTTSLGEFYLVNVTASKTLHFTIPANGPIELWHLLTLTAPAFLFTFLNQAICLGPHILFDALIAARHTGEASHATP
jgi:hypothetical protein